MRRGSWASTLPTSIGFSLLDAKWHKETDEIKYQWGFSILQSYLDWTPERALFGFDRTYYKPTSENPEGVITTYFCILFVTQSEWERFFQWILRRRKEADDE